MVKKGERLESYLEYIERLRMPLVVEHVLWKTLLYTFSESVLLIFIYFEENEWSEIAVSNIIIMHKLLTRHVASRNLQNDIPYSIICESDTVKQIKILQIRK